MEIKKLTDVKEIDEIIPLIKKLHDDVNTSQYFSLAGYITWIVINFPLGNFQIWKVYNETGTKGFLIAQITNRHFVMECHILEALMELNDEEATEAIFNHIVEWAKSKNCEQITIKSKREKAFEKKYGFEYFGSEMIKKI